MLRMVLTAQGVVPARAPVPAASREWQIGAAPRDLTPNDRIEYFEFGCGKRKHLLHARTTELTCIRAYSA